MIAFIGIPTVRNWISKPKLDIKVDTTSPDCVKTPLKYLKDGKQFDSDGYYIRIQIINAGNYQANNVEVFMSELIKDRLRVSKILGKHSCRMNLTWTHIQ